MKFADFTELTKKFKLRKKSIPAAWPTPIYVLSMTSMVWNIPTGYLGLSVWLCFLPAPAHLVISLFYFLFLPAIKTDNPKRTFKK